MYISKYNLSSHFPPILANKRGTQRTFAWKVSILGCLGPRRVCWLSWGLRTKASSSSHPESGQSIVTAASPNAR